MLSFSAHALRYQREWIEVLDRCYCKCGHLDFKFWVQALEGGNLLGGSLDG